MEQQLIHRPGLETRRSVLGKFAAGLATLSLPDALNAGLALGEDDHHAAQRRVMEKAFHVQDEVYRKIANAGMQRYFDGLPDRERAFFSKREIAEASGVCACCSDEGNSSVQDAGKREMPLIRTPGSWIIYALDREDRDPLHPEFIDWVAREALAAGVTVFSGHGGCGAGKAVLAALLAAQGKMKDADHPTEEEVAEFLTSQHVDACIMEFTRKVTDRMRELASGEIITARFIRPQEMHRPNFHIGRGLYYGKVDAFRASYPGLPQGFVERRGRGPIQQELSHVAVLQGIAFHPHHGFGTLFTHKPSEQFVLCVVADTRKKVEELEEQAEKQRSGLPGDLRERIRVEQLVSEGV